MKRIDSFDITPGEVILGKYHVETLLGAGWEGEVYLIKEAETGIERAAKLFFPQRNVHKRASKFYAKKLHKLRHCNMIIKYHTQETRYMNDLPITILISEFIEGELLSEFLKRQPGKRLQSFTALHLLHALAKGMEEIHRLKEYHGDLHTENIIIQRQGLGFELKILDFYHWGKATAEHIHDDVVDLITIFYEVLGGKKYYAGLPKVIKEICCGRKRSIILKKFKSAGKLREYIENLTWDE